VLRGYLHSYVGEYDDCPQLDKLIKEKGGLVPQIETRPLKLEINRDMQDVKLIFPFPYCVEANPE
jgi:hypothetical protein